MQQVMEEALEEDEADAEFWGQEFWAEAEDDDEFESEDAGGEEGEDEFDSDFNDTEESESEGDEDRAVRREERAEASAARKRASAYKDPAAAKRAKGAGATHGGGGETPRRSGRGSRGQGEETTTTTSTPGEGGEGSRRKSGRESAVRAGIQLETSLAAQQREEARRKREREAGPAKVPFKRFTQAELLEEAKQTAVANTASLHRLQLREEEAKARARMDTLGKGMGGRPWMRSSSRSGVRDGATVLTFYGLGELPREIRAQSVQDPPEPLKCAITGVKAKYRDPKTGLGYCDAEGFKLIRQRAGL